MGCGSSKPATTGEDDGKSDMNHHNPRQPREVSNGSEALTPAPPTSSAQKPTVSGVAFREYAWEELAQATNDFSELNMLSTKGQPNHVYSGRLSDGRSIAVKKYNKRDWPDQAFFVSQASGVGSLRLPGLVALVGVCFHPDRGGCLVAELMPKNTLAHHLFHWEKEPLPWTSRLAAALTVARTLDEMQRREEKFSIYHDLTAERVLFDAEDQPRLSCFGLIRPFAAGTYSSNISQLPPEYFESGTAQVTPESVVWSYGTLLLAVMSGKSIRPKQFLELAAKKELEHVVDSNLLQSGERERAMELVPLCCHCLKDRPAERPTFEGAIKMLLVLEARSKGIMGPDSEFDSEAILNAPRGAGIRGHLGAMVEEE
eukprot:TRINITY_DN15972_c0_g3_i1.p1 TRINITY_DN15972_c0_g3~~TRINITY_DN15972_c0_g3_i1.p1  ORF type:complete len:371 (+),score=89.17 TRINITY_DN15972_c0_g3_i1:438-1550(+)